MDIIKTVLELVGQRETILTRELAEGEHEDYDNKVYDDFKKNLVKTIKQTCRYKSSLLTELTEKPVYDRRDQLAEDFKALGYDVVLIDDKIPQLKDLEIDKGFLCVSWGKRKP